MRSTSAASPDSTSNRRRVSALTTSWPRPPGRRPIAGGLTSCSADGGRCWRNSGVSVRSSARRSVLFGTRAISRTQNTFSEDEGRAEPGGGPHDGKRSQRKRDVWLVEKAAFGEAGESGAETPMISARALLTLTVRPMTDGSPPKVRCQNRWLMTATSGAPG